MSAASPWVTLALLGAYHGVNPAMGWLFAVSRGFQEDDARAVARALPAIALGHALSIAAALALLALGSSLFASNVVRVVMALLLVGFGLYRLLRPRHPRWVGMRLGFTDLALWSFVMASAHGAGLMLIPVFLLNGSKAVCGHCAVHAGLELRSWPGYLAAVGLHTLSMFLVAGCVAFVVYWKLGLGLLRKAWFNVDVVWSLALLLAGVAAFLL
jgi:hypothetical protein